MKNIKYIISLGVSMLLTGFAATSCTDDNDWDTDDSTNRLFSVVESSLSVSPDETKATVKWTKTPNTEYYVIEISKDTLYNDIEMGTTNEYIIFGEDKSIVTSPYVLSGLDSDSKYYIRIKAMSTQILESKWTYLDKRSFKTKPEQIMNAVTNTDKTSNSVRLSWTGGEKVTKIVLSQGGDVVNEVILTQDDIAAGEITITGLTGGTYYQADLYNNSVRRGYAIFSTFADSPAADYIIYLDETDEINQVYLDSLATLYPGKTITLAFANNATYIVTDKLTIPDNMSINFYGVPGTKKTLLNLNTIDYTGTHNYITFQNLNINCLQKDYLMNQTEGADVNKVLFDDCIIQNIKRSLFRMQKGGNKTVESLIINNCIFVSAGGDGYNLIHIDAVDGNKIGVVKNISITRSTFNKVSPSGKGFIYSNKTNMESLIIDQCTFYNVVGKGQRFIDFGSKNGAATFTISNTILSKTGDKDACGIRSNNPPVITNTYATKDWYQGNTSSEIMPYGVYNGTAAELFNDPNNGVFTFKDGSLGNIGDPRWW